MHWESCKGFQELTILWGWNVVRRPSIPKSRESLAIIILFVSIRGKFSERNFPPPPQSPDIFMELIIRRQQEEEQLDILRHSIRILGDLNRTPPLRLECAKGTFSQGYFPIFSSFSSDHSQLKDTSGMVPTIIVDTSR